MQAPYSDNWRNERSMFESVPIERVREFWDRRPCNVRHSPQPVGSRAYFEEVEARKYFVEPHIPAFAEFPRWLNKRVLEIGCGIGTDTINFARHGASVTAVELSPKSLQIAQRRALVYGLSDRIRFYEGNAEELRRFVPVEAYDLVYAFGVIHHTPHPGRVVRQLRSYMHRGSTLKLMVYHRYAWKVLWIVFAYGRGRIWRVADLVARYSEAESGCPVTYTWDRKGVRGLVEREGFRVLDIRVEHIFPYRIADYLAYRYVKVWYFRWMPAWLFRAIERRLGWHLCVTAEAV